MKNKFIVIVTLLMTIQVACMAQQHDYVDLGLPSGTLWATCNVGANSPEEYGDYFAWGETSPKTTYSWNNYKYCKDGDSHKFTKYCNRGDYGNNGYTDSRTTLESTDDAATINWGSDWCMPTKDQFDELNKECTWTWTSKNGKDGYEVKGANGNTVFLPATTADGRAGGYWSSSLGANSSTSQYLQFNSDHVYVSLWFFRCIGYSVRPVRRI